MYKYLTAVCSLLVQSAPLLIAAYGALLSEYTGLLNVGIEGLMLTGAFIGVCVLSCVGETLGFIGIAFALVCAAAVGAVVAGSMGCLTLRRHADFYILGLAVNLLASGSISLVTTRFFDNQAIILLPKFFTLHPGGVWTVHLILLAFIGFSCVYVLQYTKIGLRLRLLSANSTILYAAGVSTESAKLSALVVSGSLAAAAGCLLPLKLGAFVQNQSAGKGWLALVLVYAGGKSAVGVAAATFLFVYLENRIAAAQMGLEHPAVLIGLPFFLGLFIIIIEKIGMKIMWKPLTALGF